MSTAGPILVVVGGGPAGLAAAASGAEAGLRTTLIDETDRLGGQYFRGRQGSNEVGSPRRFAAVAGEVRVLSSAVMVDTPASGVLSVWRQQEGGVEDVAYDRLVVATGAYDRPVALPGWTLPGVMGAGGASTLAKVHGIAAGKRILIGGAGPFLFAVADDLSEKGADVEIVDATPWAASVRGIPAIAADGEIARQTLGYVTRQMRRGVRRRYGEVVTAIHGKDRVEAATIHAVDGDWRPIDGTARTVEVDAVCLGFGFVPQLELAQALYCRLVRDERAANYFVQTDAATRTSVVGVYAAGEVTGTDGKRVAVAEGALAGLTAALDAGVLGRSDYEVRAQPLLARLRKVRRVANWIRDAYAPQDGLFTLATPETVICRCEDIRRSEADAALATNSATPYAVKTATRAGMGLCQGRICAPYLTEWLRVVHGYRPPPHDRAWRLRPPLRPVPLAAWLSAKDRPA